MLSEIYYFSGTGNCLAAARMINEKSKEKSEIISIPAFDGNSVIKADRVGFIFPVFCHKIPNIVKQFILKIEFDSSPYIYAVATQAGETGQCLYDVQALLIKKGQYLSLGIALDMPGNAIETKPDDELERLSGLERKAEEIAKTIDAQKKVGIDGENGIKEHIRNSIVSFFAWNYIFSPKRFKVSNDCTGCGTCEKLCPVNNIHFSNNKPEWKNGCATCLACFHWCPNEAISMDNRVIKKRRKYHHPDICTYDMIYAKKYRK